jgi:hypothetical protein
MYIVDDFGDLFSEFVMKFMLYVTIGFIVYHLIVKKAIDKHILKVNQPKKVIRQQIQKKHKQKPKPKSNK